MFFGPLGFIKLILFKDILATHPLLLVRNVSMAWSKLLTSSLLYTPGPVLGWPLIAFISLPNRVCGTCVGYISLFRVVPKDTLVFGSAVTEYCIGALRNVKTILSFVTENFIG